MDRQLKELFDAYEGILRTSDLLRYGYYHRRIQKMISDGEIEQIRRGYYQRIDDNAYSEVSVIARLLPDAGLCRESALD